MYRTREKTALPLIIHQKRVIKTVLLNNQHSSLSPADICENDVQAIQI